MENFEFMFLPWMPSKGRHHQRVGGIGYYRVLSAYLQLPTLLEKTVVENLIATLYLSPWMPSRRSASSKCRWNRILQGLVCISSAAHTLGEKFCNLFVVIQPVQVKSDFKPGGLIDSLISVGFERMQTK